MGKLLNFFDLFKRNSSLENNNINKKLDLNDHKNLEFNLKDNDCKLSQIDNNGNIKTSKEPETSNYALNNAFNNESDFLKLFKYDSIADGTKTFNIETALNNNWDKIDTFATNTSQQLEDKADKESPQFTGTPTINGNEIATVNNIPEGLSLGETSTTAYRGDRGKLAYDHSQSVHAPTNAQKNSDITKAEIEAKLTGEILTHSHTSDSSKAPNNHASLSTTYGVATTTNYGHVRIVDSLVANSGNLDALSAYQGRVLSSKIDGLVASAYYPYGSDNNISYSHVDFIVPKTGKYRIILIGRGGSSSVSYSEVGGVSPGGGGGAYVESLLTLTKGSIYTINRNSSGISFGTIMTAGHGSYSQALASSDAATSREGGAGGIAFGGNVHNINGSQGGTATKTSTAFTAGSGGNAGCPLGVPSSSGGNASQVVTYNGITCTGKKGGNGALNTQPVNDIGNNYAYFSVGGNGGNFGGGIGGTAKAISGDISGSPTAGGCVCLVFYEGE